MPRMRAAAVLAASLVTFLGCSDPGGGGGDDGGDDDPSPDAALPDGWTSLITSTWTLEPGEEYRCERLTVTEDTWIRAFRSVTPLGSHHAVLTIDPDGGDAPDGQVTCGAGSNYTAMIYGSAPGTEDIVMPDGVAVRVPAGAQLLLNLHLYNTQPDGPITGTSEILIDRVPADEIASVTEAEVVLMGPVNFTIPEGTGQQVTGGCTMSGAATVFMTNPHMHQLGVHARVVAKAASGDVVLRDGPYDFNEQRFYDTGEVQLAQGERVEITCTYDNDTGGEVTFGDSTDQEMCFATTYRYPKLGSSVGGIVCPF